MKNIAVLGVVAASAAAVSAQYTFNSTTNTYTCAVPNADYCAGSSLGTDIIIRCDASGVGQPGRCSDNLDGEPPVGDFPALCWETSATSGDAACEKNCIVYAANGTFTLPTSECTPTFTASSTSASSTSSPSGGSGASSTPTTTTTSTTTSPSGVCSGTFSVTTSSVGSMSTGSGGSGGGNGTLSTQTQSQSQESSGSSATNTPIQPSSTTGVLTVPTAGAAANSVGGALAVLGLAAAYLL